MKGSLSSLSFQSSLLLLYFLYGPEYHSMSIKLAYGVEINYPSLSLVGLFLCLLFISLFCLGFALMAKAEGRKMFLLPLGRIFVYGGHDSECSRTDMWYEHEDHLQLLGLSTEYSTR